MQCHDYDTRYARQISLPEWGESGQQKLKEARVLVVGAGGLGAPLLLYLAAAGIGRVGVIDADRVALSNLPRQVLYENADIGRLKTEAARDALEDRNPEATIITHPCRLDADNAAMILADYDLIADGSDNFETRLLVNRICIQQQKTLVSGAVIGFKGQVSSFSPHLHRDNACYACLTGGMPPADTMPRCSDAGVFNAAAGVIACLMAAEVMKNLTRIGETLTNRLLRYDALTGRFQESTLPRDPTCSECGLLHC